MIKREYKRKIGETNESNKTTGNSGGRTTQHKRNIRFLRIQNFSQKFAKFE